MRSTKKNLIESVNRASYAKQAQRAVFTYLDAKIKYSQPSSVNARRLEDKFEAAASGFKHFKEETRQAYEQLVALKPITAIYGHTQQTISKIDRAPKDMETEVSDLVFRSLRLEHSLKKNFEHAERMKQITLSRLTGNRPQVAALFDAEIKPYRILKHLEQHMEWKLEDDTLMLDDEGCRPDTATVRYLMKRLAALREEVSAYPEPTVTCVRREDEYQPGLYRDSEGREFSARRSLGPLEKDLMKELEKELVR